MIFFSKNWLNRSKQKQTVVYCVHNVCKKRNSLDPDYAKKSAF